MTKTLKEDWQLEARRKLSDYWAGDWKILDDFIDQKLKEQREEIKKVIVEEHAKMQVRILKAVKNP
jgi:hypothetical protein